jgi:hypothetical protein
MRTLKTGTGHLIERILPKADARASCWNDCWVQRDSKNGRCRRCCFSALNCLTTCGTWATC